MIEEKGALGAQAYQHRLWQHDCRRPHHRHCQPGQRARQLVDGAQPLIDPKDMKPLKIAVEEINRGLLTYQRDPDLED